MLDVRCPGCAKLLQVVETATDRNSVCPACGAMFRPLDSWTETRLTERPSLTSAAPVREPEAEDWADDSHGIRLRNDMNEIRLPSANNAAVEDAVSAARAELRRIVRFAIIAFTATCCLAVVLIIRLPVNDAPLEEAIASVLFAAFISATCTSMFAWLIAHAPYRSVRRLAGLTFGVALSCISIGSVFIWLRPIDRTVSDVYALVSFSFCVAVVAFFGLAIAVGILTTLVQLAHALCDPADRRSRE
jgi:phage FluMu protein Com